MTYEVTTPAYETLNRLGSINPRNSLEFKVVETQDIGVTVETSGSKKPISAEIVVPIHRSRRGSRRAAHFRLNGTQTRRLYEALSKFYEQRNEG